MEPSQRLIIDSRHHLVVCGRAHSGKTRLASFLSSQYAVPVTVIDPTSVSYRHAIDFHVISPNDHACDTDFYEAAGKAIQGALDLGDGLLVVDGLDLLAAPYSMPMRAQERFLDIVRETLIRAHDTGLVVIVVSREPPGKPILDQCLLRVVTSDVDDSDWGLLAGDHAPRPTAVPPGSGFLIVDGAARQIALPRRIAST